MTTIAWDGKTLAADRRVTEGKTICCEFIKIRRLADGRVVGGAGELDVLSLMFDWLEAGGAADDRPTCMAAKSVTEVLEVTPKGEIWLHMQHGRVPLVRGPQALGSGAAYARAAMECGKSAAEAVRIASKFDAGTGTKVDAMELR